MPTVLRDRAVQVRTGGREVPTETAAFFFFRKAEQRAAQESAFWRVGPCRHDELKMDFRQTEGAHAHVSGERTQARRSLPAQLKSQVSAYERKSTQCTDSSQCLQTIISSLTAASLLRSDHSSRPNVGSIQAMGDGCQHEAPAGAFISSPEPRPSNWSKKKTNESENRQMSVPKARFRRQTSKLGVYSFVSRRFRQDTVQSSEIDAWRLFVISASKPRNFDLCVSGAVRRDF